MRQAIEGLYRSALARRASPIEVVLFAAARLIRAAAPSMPSLAEVEPWSLGAEGLRAPLFLRRIERLQVGDEVGDLVLG